MILKSIIVRPVTPNDLSDIHKLSLEAKPGLTSLSKEKSSIRVYDPTFYNVFLIKISRALLMNSTFSYVKI